MEKFESSFGLDFSSIEVIEIPVVGPDKNNYVLREASGDSVARFNNARGRCVQFKDGGMSSVDGQGDLEAFLVSLCLFHIKDDCDTSDPSTWTADVKKSVKAPIIRAWPERVVRPLFEKAKEISEVDEPEDLKTLQEQRNKLDEQIKNIERNAPKNERDDTPVGCD